MDDDLVCKYCGVKNENYDTLEACLQKHLDALLNDDESREPEIDDEMSDNEIVKIEVGEEVEPEQPNELEIEIVDGDPPINKVAVWIEKHFNANDVKKFQCTKCAYKCKQKEHLPSHMKTHEVSDLMSRKAAKLKTYECNQCTYWSKWKHNLHKHLKEVHGVSIPYQPRKRGVKKCDLCSYESVRKFCIVQHMRVHMRSIDCSKCNESFRTFHRLRQHEINIHSGPSQRKADVKKYKCDLCSFVSKIKQVLKRHMRVHIRSFDCPNCNESFGTFYSLSQHRINAHAKKSPYQCNQCSERFSTYYQKQKHIQKSHPSTIEYQCPKCCYILLTKKALDKHFKIRH